MDYQKDGEERLFLFFEKIKNLILLGLFGILLFGSFMGPFFYPLFTTSRIFIIAFGILFLTLFNFRFRLIGVPKVFLLYIGFAFICLVSFLYSYDTALTIIEFRHIIIAIMVFLGVYNYAISLGRVKYLLKLYVALLFFYSFYLILRANVFSLGGRFVFDEKSYNVIMLEFFIGLVFCFLLAGLSKRKWLYYGLGAFFSVVVIATGSVKGFLAIFLFYLLILLSKRLKVKRTVSLKISLRRTFFVVSLGSVLFVSIFYVMKQGILDRGLTRSIATVMFLITNNTEFSGDAAGSVGGTRGNLIELGLDFWKERPILGSGINNYRYLIQKSEGYSTYSHSTIIEVMVGTGIIGTFLYYSFLGGVLFKFVMGYLRTREKLFLILVFGLIVLIMISFGQRMYADLYQFLFLGIAFTLANLIRKNSFRLG